MPCHFLSLAKCSLVYTGFRYCLSLMAKDEQYTSRVFLVVPIKRLHIHQSTDFTQRRFKLQFIDGVLKGTIDQKTFIFYFKLCNLSVSCAIEAEV